MARRCTVYWKNVTLDQVMDEFHHTRAKNLARQAAATTIEGWPGAPS